MVKIAFTQAVHVDGSSANMLRKLSKEGILLHYELRQHSVMVTLGVKDEATAEEILRKAHAELAEPLRATLSEAKRAALDLELRNSPDVQLAPVVRELIQEARPEFIRLNCSGVKFVTRNDHFSRDLIANLALAGVSVRAEPATNSEYLESDRRGAAEALLALLSK